MTYFHPGWLLLRSLAWLGITALIFLPLEALLPLHKAGRGERQVTTDLGWFFLNGMVTLPLVGLFAGVVAYAIRLFEPVAIPTFVGGLPLWLRLILALVVGEFGFYWGHRWMHEIPLLWRFHAIHHSAEQIDWLVNTRAHPVDMVFTRICGFIPLYLVGLARPMGVDKMDMLPLLVILIGTTWGFFIHSNLNWRFGWLEWLISTPAFHHWHHTNDGPALINKNYAAMIPWVDKIFGTLYLPKQWPAKYGIDGPMAPGLAGQLIQPFDYRQ